jgi:hypothetical protein
MVLFIVIAMKTSNPSNIIILRAIFLHCNVQVIVSLSSLFTLMLKSLVYRPVGDVLLLVMAVQRSLGPGHFWDMSCLDSRLCENVYRMRMSASSPAPPSHPVLGCQTLALYLTPMCYTQGHLLEVGSSDLLAEPALQKAISHKVEDVTLNYRYI